MLKTFFPLVNFSNLWSLVLYLAFISSAHSSQNSILVFGDSISAGYGMQAEESWPALMAEKITSMNFDYKVINASVSGETTGGGFVRLGKALEDHNPDLLILELGGNDGLRGYPIGKIKENLAGMISVTRSQKIEILLIGMVLPPNYGRRYTQAFKNIYTELSSEFDINLIPVLLDGIVTSESLMQRDGIHPKAEAQSLLVDDIWPYVERFVRERGKD